MRVTPTLLYVDDERLLHGVLERLFARHGIDVVTSSSAIEAVELLKKQKFDMVITDFKMPEMDGLELLAHVREHYPDTQVMMITAHANIQHAVGVLREGAIDYLPKPFSTSALLERVQEHLKSRETAPTPADAPSSNGRKTRARTRPESRKAVYVGEHPSIQQLKGLLPRVARSMAPAFVHGESGTGKEIISRLLHQESDRADGPYVTLNCANLPRELVESHLFGHRKGAFTGAIDDMVGAFEKADGGTLLLDEITEIDLGTQAKLLRVIQEQEFTRIGSSEPQKVNVRIVATSNRDLQQAVEDNIFRADLYHRLAVFPLYVPPLRERLSDVPSLAEHFLVKYCTLYEMPRKTLSPELLQYFFSYTWPGNVRQLENMVHRGVVLAADNRVIQLNDVMSAFFTERRPVPSAAPVEQPTAPVLAAPVEVHPEPVSETRVETLPAVPVGAAPRKRMTIEEMERTMILETLEETRGNQQEAAELLGICARTIRNKLKKYREDGFTN